MPQKHIPERSCIACNRKREKRELVRVVRNAEGQVGLDPTGKKAGRGAYLCRDIACWTRGLERRGQLEHALRGPITAEDRSMLQLKLQEFARVGLAAPAGDPA